MLARSLLLLVLGLVAAGCMISEQDGQLIPDGNPKYWDQKLGEVSFHFGSTFNRVVVFGRSAALALVAFWILAPSRGQAKGAGSILAGLAFLALASWLLYLDLSTLHRYRIAALESGLVLNVPPDPPLEVPWSAVDSMVITGLEFKKGPAGPGSKNAFADLPEWETMDLHFADGQARTVDLGRLSVEQRQSVWKAIAVRAQLVERK